MLSLLFFHDFFFFFMIRRPPRSTLFPYTTRFQIVRGKTYNVAWILAGNFRFPKNAARHENGAIPPLHKLLIAIGDFVVTSIPLQSPLVTRLHLPRHPSGVRSSGLSDGARRHGPRPAARGSCGTSASRRVISSSTCSSGQSPAQE